MRCLILAVFLAIVQTTPPVPQKTADNNAAGGQDVARHAKEKKQATALAQSPMDSVESKPNKNESNNESKNDNAKSIVVRELPTVSVSASWRDNLSLTLTGILTLVGLAGVCAAYRTLRAIESQTKALIDSQRARIAAKAHGSPTQTLADRESPRVEIELFNRGRTEACDFTYESWMETLSFPFQDFSPAADHFRSLEKLTLYPDHIPLIINIPIRQGLTETQLYDLRKLKSFACIRVRVEFKDAFSPKRWADFGFYITSSGLGFLPKYNNSN